MNLCKKNVVKVFLAGYCERMNGPAVMLILGAAVHAAVNFVTHTPEWVTFCFVWTVIGLTFCGYKAAMAVRTAVSPDKR